jgi:hypothetical protein
MTRVLAVLAGVLAAAAIGVQATDARPGGDDHHRGGAILRFDTMAPVDGPFVGTDHPVRTLAGGGLPWELRRARGELRRDGRLDVKVEGLVLARKAPVPANLQGTNPIAQMRAVVSCLTPDAPADGEIRATDLVPASPQGDLRIRTRVDLPHPCVAPVVFITSPANQWFAVTGA